LVFPSFVAVAVGGALGALQRGVSGEVVVGACLVLTVVLVAALERTLPHRRSWNVGRGDAGADAVYLPMTLLINGALEPAVKVVATAIGASLTGILGMGLWPLAWPLLAQLGLACVVAEFFDYFAHRVMHENAWLWRFHAVHHSPLRVYWLNATRSHPGEMLFRGTVGLLPLAILGAGRDVFVLLGVVNVVVGFFQHANVDFRLGPLGWIFSVGDLHRWHHSRLRAEADCNYGNNFIFWDAVFGTRFLPRDRPPPAEVGIEGLEAFPKGLIAQILSPFRWQRMLGSTR
jgi:sterol desaturase/sphingolipid hydroxylase (fatty acid hydroxylase superfamily)